LVFTSDLHPFFSFPLGMILSLSLF
jgi:hypothetical protein